MIGSGGFIARAINAKIAVVGDYIEDRYVTGVVDRVSPEAPVPVLLKKDFQMSPGGAGNVWLNLRNLGVDAYLFIDHDDPSIWTGETRVFINPNAHAVKTRYMAGNHHLLRVDEEPDVNEMTLGTFKSLEWADKFTTKILANEFDCVVISDYHKGVVSKSVAEMVVALCLDSGTPCIVDAKHTFERFNGANILKCNKKEGNNIPDYWKTIEELKLNNLIITQGENGIDLYKAGSKVPVRTGGLNVDMVDVCGAGDVVTAILAIGLAAGIDIEDSIRLANQAAAHSCKHVGVYAITQDDVLNFD